VKSNEIEKSRSRPDIKEFIMQCYCTSKKKKEDGLLLYTGKIN
jgi:hypothetical protein